MNILELNNSIKIRNQFIFNSINVLLPEVKTAFGYNDINAKKFIASICKLITFWFEAYYKNLFSYDVISFLRKCVNEGIIRKEDAYLNESLGFYDGIFQKSFAEKFNINATGMNNYKNFIIWALKQKEFVGTLRIINSKETGKHSLIVYKQNNSLFISDTSSRGIGVPFEKFINEKNFIYFTSLCK